MARKPTPSRMNQRVSAAAAKLDNHKLLLGVLVALVGAFLAYVAFVSTTGPPFQSRYEIDVHVPADAPPMRVGQAVRVSGKLAGLVSDVQPDRENGGTIVTANITKPDFRPIGTDAEARVTVHSIVYATYLEIVPGNTDDPMENGGEIPQDRVSSGVDLLEVVQLFDEEARESLRKTTVNLGYGIAGRGEGLNQALSTAEPTTTNLNAQITAINEDEGAVGEGLAGASELSAALEGTSPDDIGGLIASGAGVGVAVANQREALAQSIRLLRPFEDEFLETAPIAEPLFADLAETSRKLEPVVGGLNSALPDVHRLLGLGNVLEDETRLITNEVSPVLRTTRPLVHEIFPIVAALNPLLPDVDTVVEGITPYRKDIAKAGTGLAEATSVRYPQGQGVGAGAPMGRVIPVFTCHPNRNPFPGPGEAVEDSAGC